ncbi:exonuclease domain-containing protein [Tropicimonas sp. IMCC34011]|uniref:3'-5' exonuclease n=1 Tax=Tropicimonas sp. IMCC34011 TaxID=2248759 RepID=UPI000E281AA1|nr:exonuclease domain-containing protein [Tropicimonas sp. IMCC34011]
MIPAIEKYVALDFEASSLSADSWPIEVGLSWLAGGDVVSWSSLIRPADDWPMSDWSHASEQVHGIPFDALTDAPTPEAVASELRAQLAGRLLVSDAPCFDSRWLERLMNAADTHAVGPILDFDQVNFSLFHGASLDSLYERFERSAVPHRAGPDSARMARAWLRAVQVEGGC